MGLQVSPGYLFYKYFVPKGTIESIIVKPFLYHYRYILYVTVFRTRVLSNIDYHLTKFTLLPYRQAGRFQFILLS